MSNIIDMKIDRKTFDNTTIGTFLVIIIPFIIEYLTGVKYMASFTMLIIAYGNYVYEVPYHLLSREDINQDKINGKKLDWKGKYL